MRRNPLKGEGVTSELVEIHSTKPLGGKTGLRLHLTRAALSAFLPRMSRISYVNGQYVPHQTASVHIEDRGYQFADGVYEVIHVCGGRIVDERWHLDRLERSLAEIRIAMPMARRALEHVLRQVIRRNGLTFGGLYLQVTRGVAKRDFPFPRDAAPALVVTALRMQPYTDAKIAAGVKVITVPDIRWGRCDIKSIGLLAPVLGKQQAREAGAFEAWQVDTSGHITEGTSTNAWIVTADGTLVTRAADYRILNGVTRLRLIALAQELGLKVTERSFTVTEAQAAAEAFLSSTTTYLLPVTTIDGVTVGGGVAGPVALKLRAAYADFVAQQKAVAV
jgi:D-alanine transaminase